MRQPFCWPDFICGRAIGRERPPGGNCRSSDRKSGSRGSGENAGEQEIPDYILDPNREMPVLEADGNLYIGILKIPALNLELPVMSDWSYPQLRTAPCRYAGSAYQDDLVIAAHNYRRHFGLLGTLAAGEMTDSGYGLTLFTCTPGGRTRLAVRCAAVHANGTAGI